MRNAVETSHATQSSKTDARHTCVSDRVLGIALISLVPSLFWTAVAAFVLPYTGIAIAASDLALIGVGIALFLAVIATALTEREG